MLTSPNHPFSRRETTVPRSLLFLYEHVPKWKGGSNPPLNFRVKTLSVLARTGRWIPTPSTDGEEEEEERRGGLVGRKARVPGTRQQHPTTATHESSLNPRFRLGDDDKVDGEGMVAVGQQLDSGAGMTRSRLRLCWRRPT